MNTRNLESRAYIAWITTTIFYLYQYLLRVFPNLMGQEIRADFNMTAEQFGMLGAFTLYAYSLAQLPLGAIVDKIGVRKTVTWSIITCIIGAYIISKTHNSYVAYFGRFIIGLGSASAFMCSLKIATDFLPVGKRGVLIGATLAVGTTGIVLFTKPLVWLMDLYGWRNAVSLLAALGIVSLSLCFLFIPKVSNEVAAKRNKADILNNIKTVITNKNIVFYALIAVALYSPFTVIGDLWGTDFISIKYLLDLNQAKQMTTMLYLGLAIGSLILPWLAEKYQVIDEVLFISIIGLLICFTLLVYGPLFSSLNLKILLISIGFFCGGEMICFTGSTVYSTVCTSGITIGFVNFSNVFFAGVAQHIVGMILDKNWQGITNQNGIRMYQAEEYVTSFGFLIWLIIICMILTFYKIYKKQ